MPFASADGSADNHAPVVSWSGEHMKALFLGHFAASVAPRVLAKVKTPLETSILDDEGDVEVLAPLLAAAEIVVGHIWRRSFPPAPRLRLLQSVAAGLDLLDTEAVPKGVTICAVFGHEPAIAEYVIMTMLVLTHRLFETVTAFRAGSWVASPTLGGGPPHGEVLGRTIGIIGYGRIGREVAERAAGLKCRVLAANRSPVTDPAPADTVFPFSELDRMLPLCDTVIISCGLAPETRGLIDTRRLALMKSGALLINVARAAIVEEGALYAALKDGHLGGAALDVWWQYPTRAEPERSVAPPIPRTPKRADHAAQLQQY